MRDGRCAPGLEGEEPLDVSLPSLTLIGPPRRVASIAGAGQTRAAEWPKPVLHLQDVHALPLFPAPRALRLPASHGSSGFGCGARQPVSLWARAGRVQGGRRIRGGGRARARREERRGEMGLGERAARVRPFRTPARGPGSRPQSPSSRPVRWGRAPGAPTPHRSGESRR